MGRAEQECDRVGRSRSDAGDAVGAGLENGALAQQGGDFLEDGHGTPASIG